MIARRPAGPPRRQSEKAEQAAIVKLLYTIGAAVYVLGTKRPKGDFQGTRQTPGIPDLYAFLPAPNKWPRTSDRALWIEVKARGGKPSLAQRAFRIHCEAFGHPYLLGGTDVVIKFLKEGGWLR